MQHATKSRRWSDGQNSSGGPGGAAIQPGPAPANEDEHQLTIEDARSIEDFYLRGGATRHVPVRTQTIQQLRRMREAGLIETLQDVRGKDTARLTPRAMQRLVEANKLSRAARRA